ncbi:MAG: WecB/TagA/CpsF family glycosyltransferase [Nitrospinota bacterium]|nr:WecB/TagA/CpsF family glycosyltransferase [Nitrospinota bacterium]
MESMVESESVQAPSVPDDEVLILGVRFYNGDVEGAIGKILKGGLLVAPSGPGLALMDSDAEYVEALVSSDVAVADSGLMTLVWNLFGGRRLQKLSGVKLFRALVGRKELKSPGALFMIDPSERESNLNIEFMKECGIAVDESSVYIAPFYGKGVTVDEDLVAILEKIRPSVVLVNIGGGVQEKLGLYLKRRLSFQPAIICTGAAIAFSTGAQANIPNIVDRLYLGWLWRCLYEPRRYIPRYLYAAKAFILLLRHWDKSPDIGKR